MDYNLGRLEKVKLREVWTHEAINFTNWLSKEENLELLSQELGIENIKLKRTEAPAGNFNVDILAEEENTERNIIIENQLEVTNHDHLGKIITYASGHNAEIIIWIVKEVRDEHKQAIDWLNEHTNDKINFFAVKMELWKIGNSDPAPKFQIISKPNNWTKEIRKDSNRTEPTETKLLQLEFWNYFKDKYEEESILRFRNPRPQHWYSFAIGSGIAYMSYTASTRDNKIACEIYIPKEQGLFNELIEKKELIEKEIGKSLEWMELPEGKASRIKLSIEGDINNKEEWGRYVLWMKKTGERFLKVFSRYIPLAKESMNMKKEFLEEVGREDEEE